MSLYAVVFLELTHGNVHAMQGVAYCLEWLTTTLLCCSKQIAEAEVQEVIAAEKLIRLLTQFFLHIISIAWFEQFAVLSDAALVQSHD
jgi:hypothetical protein